MEMQPAVIEAKGLTKRFGDAVALDRLELQVAAGETVCLLGANGAGKTTTINLFLGFLEPSAGAALVDGVEVSRDPAAARRKLGYVAEVVALYPTLTGRRTSISSPSWRASGWTAGSAMRSLCGCGSPMAQSIAGQAPIPRGCAKSWALRLR